MADPLPICHLNGALLPLREARISPLDRSFLFGDGIYEVIPARNGDPRRLAAHLARLARSLREIQLINPHTDADWTQLVNAVIAANGGGDVYVYLQVSRGAEYGRNHAPLPLVPPTVFAFCAPLPLPTAATLEHGVSCITAADTRWARCDIKSVALLANVLLRQEAVDAGASETILLRDGLLTEASASSVYIVRDGALHAPLQSSQLLPSTTRGLVEELAAQNGIVYRAQTITEQQLRAADEIWLAAATRGVVAVTRLDDLPVGTGRPGPLWQRMHALIETFWTA